MSSQTKEPTLPSGERNWKADKRKGYVAHYTPPTELDPGGFDGPEDAFVWLGEPHEGSPYLTARLDRTSNKWYSCEPYLDETRVSVEIGGVKVKWIEWDTETGCNVYQRIK
jgi:hypothetical protein